MCFRKFTVSVVLFILLLSSASMAATYIAVEVPELQNSAPLVADLYSQGESTLLLGQGHSVFVLAEDTTVPLIEGILGHISALAVGDVNGDLRNDLVLGTDSGGALYFYTEKSGIWERQGQPQYLWDTIRLVEIHDFNNDGWGDVLVLTGKGEAHVLLSVEGTLYPFWKSKPGEVVVGIEAIDIDQNGYPELIYAFQSGYIAALGWEDQEFTVLWENYPWGLIESLIVLTHQSSPEWLVVTSQKMLYGWRYRNGEVVSSRLFEANELGEHLFYFAGQGLLSLSQKTGISLFELQSASVKEQWRVPGLLGDKAFYYQGDFYFRDPHGIYYKLVEGNNRWRIFLHNQEITESVAILNHDGELFYRLPDLAQRLGAVEIPDNSWYYVLGGHEIVLDPEHNRISYDNVVIPMTNPILEMDGLPYVSAEVFPLFGWRVELDSSRQHVIFQQNWGWWL